MRTTNRDPDVDLAEESHRAAIILCIDSNGLKQEIIKTMSNLYRIPMRILKSS